MKKKVRIGRAHVKKTRKLPLAIFFRARETGRGHRAIWMAQMMRDRSRLVRGCCHSLEDAVRVEITTRGKTAEAADNLNNFRHPPFLVHLHSLGR